MNRWPLAALALLLIVAPVSAQTKEALDLVPDDALGFILIKNLDQLSNKVEKLAKKLKAEEHFSLLELVKKQMGMDKGLKEKGSALFIVPNPKTKTDMPTAVLALPVTDYQQVAEQLGVKDAKQKIAEGAIAYPFMGILAGVSDPKEKNGADAKPPKVQVLVAKKGNFALLALHENRSALEQILDSKKSLTATLQPAQDWLGEQDIAGVCTHKGVKVGLGMMVANPFLAAGSDTKDQYGKMKKTFDEFEKNVKLIAFGARLEEEGHSRLLTRVYFDPAGSYAKELAKAKPLQGELLARFPSRPYLLAGLVEVSSHLNLEWVKEIYAQDFPADKAEELAKETLQLLKQVSQAGLVVYQDETEAKPAPKNGAAGAGPAVKAVVLAKVKDAPAFVEDAFQLLTRVEKNRKNDDQFQVTEKPKKLQINGRPVVMVPVVQKEDPTAKVKTPDNGKENGKPEKAKTHFLIIAALDDKTVSAGEVPEEKQAKQWVEQIAQHKDKGLAADAQLKKTVALLPEKLQLAVYINVKEFANALVGAPEGIAAPKFPDAPPLAFAFHIFDSGSGVEAQFVLPFETTQGFFQMGREATEKKKPVEEK